MSRSRASGSADIRTASRRAIAAACVGNAAEWYDFAIYGALASVIGFVFFPALDPATALSAAFVAYGTALLIRPLGALIFGHLGDTRGRRTVLVRVIFLMSGATAAVGLLPGYASIGVLAPILLMFLRGTQGLAAGGELGVAAVFILENARRQKRGRAAAWHTATMAIGIGTGMGVAGLLSVVFGGHGTESGWWRLPFLVALPLGLVGVYLRRRVTETSSFLSVRAASRVDDRPARELFGRHRLALARGFCLIAAGSLAFNVFFIFAPNNLISKHGTPLGPTLLVTAAALVLAAVAALGLGRVSDLFGRRPVVISSTAALVLLAVPMSMLASSGPLVALFVADVLIGFAVAGALSIAMLGELFAAPVRSTGLALTAGLASALIGGTAPATGQLLVNRLGTELAPGIYVVVVAGAALAALWRWPETAFKALD